MAADDTTTTPAAITFVIPGQRVASGTRGDGAVLAEPALGGIGGTVKSHVRVGATRGGGGERVTAVPGQDVVVLQIENGPALVLHPETARDLMLAQGKQYRGPSRGAAADADAMAVAPGEVAVPAQFRWQGLEQSAATRGATRGFLGEVLLRAVQVVSGQFGEKLAQSLQQKAAQAIASRIDGKVGNAVYRLRADSLGALKDEKPVDTMAPTPAGGATLVLLHGTFSDTPGTFGKLWAMHPQRVRSLFEHYHQEVYALDHPTLGASPIANALTLVQRCAKGMRLHLVSHSRGGLVAEVLARVCAGREPDADELAFFDDPALASDRAALLELVRLVKANDIRVERVVRVACPARGTLLASKRFDAYISVFRWALDRAGLPVVPELIEFVGGVAQCRFDPMILPGVAAMVPDSALVKWLHAVDEAVPGQLRVVAGDIEGDSVSSWVKTLLADAFYWTDNDLVVQTRSMYGGAPRVAGASFLLDQGGSTSHFSYFANERTAEAIVNGLIRDDDDGWRVIGPLSWAGESSTGTRGFFGSGTDDGKPASQKPAVFVLPGILGSHLAVDGQRIWLGWRLINGLKRLALPGAPGVSVKADGAIGLVYDGLMAHLRGLGHEVIEFSFDWRLPIEQEARRLGAALQAALDAREKTGQPVRIVAHSMGGVVTRTMSLECPAVWDRWMARPGSRFLMLGTPNGGSWAPMQCLSGDDSFGNTLVAFGAPFQDREARQLMAAFPGFLQLQAGLLDDKQKLSQTETWAKLAADDLAEVKRWNWWHDDERQLSAYQWGVPPQAVLDQAVALRRRLDAQRDLFASQPPAWRDRCLLVVGRADFTPEGFELGQQGLAYLNAPDTGDGRVPLACALLPGVRTWQLDCEHGKLPDKKEAFGAFVELLEQGRTDLLPLHTGGATRGAAGLAPAELRRSRPSRERSLPRPPEAVGELGRLQGSQPFSVPEGAGGGALCVTMHNADLRFVRQPLMLGHYISMSLTGTEAVVDGLIGGTMADSLAMGRYPDQPGTHQVFANQGRPDNPLQLPRPEATIVAGLGEEGKLRGSDLAKTVQLATVAWAQRMLEAPGGAAGSFELAATLLGSGGSGVSAGQAAQLIAQGVRLANESLAARQWPVCSHLHLIELFLDRASEAWRALQQQAQSAPRHYRLTEVVRSGGGALRRPPDFGYRGAAYDLISAIAEEQSGNGASIAYTVDTRRARSELRAQSTQLPLLRRLVQQGAHDRNTDRQIGRTLFQLLVPVELEPVFGGSSEMLLEVNSGSAGIPWELLDTDNGRQAGGDQRPWALRAKLIRKLRTDRFRMAPRDASREAQLLVIGEPRAPEGWARLPGAREEARQVSARLRAGLGPDQVADLIAPEDPAQTGPDALAVINLLMSRPWRVVHISGHGQQPEFSGAAPEKPGDPPQQLVNPRGVVLSDGAFLGVREIRAMRVVPELVFVNCCQLGASVPPKLGAGASAQLPDHAGFAASVAEALIEIGVRCVVAAGWDVEDGPAAIFASTFYGALLNGRRFIDAVAQGRQAAWDDSPEGQTWAAYQCYGDPEWTLEQGAGVRQPPRPLAEEFAGVASAPGLAIALETLAIRSRFQGTPKLPQQERIRHLEARFGPQWGSMGAVAEAFGLAWDAAGDRAKAVEWYGRAVLASDASASLKAAEQWGNLRVRLAAERAKDAGAAAATEALDEVDKALDLLSQLARLQPTMERLSLCGSAHKRRAQLLAQAERQAESDEAVVAMTQAYRAALAQGRAAAEPNLFYPAQNLVAGQVASGEPVDAEALALARASLLVKSRDDPDFWSVVGLTELRLIEALGTGSLAADLDGLLAEYALLHTRLPGTGDWRSVAEQMDFLLPRATRGKAPELAKAADRLKQQLRQYAGLKP